MRDRDEVWRAGEEAAWAVYRAQGFRLLARNWRCRVGELDLVLARGDLVVFCEVKARAGRGAPFESVTRAKARKVRTVAAAFLATARPSAGSFRFDVASVSLGGMSGPSVQLFEDAF